ncbi:hypothetical protein D3C76_609950 [compost metagenome]
MNNELSETLARFEQRSAGGLALLPDDLQVALQATPDAFRGALGAALFNLHGGAESSDYGRGLDCGHAMGLLTAGFALQLISQAQYRALAAALYEIRPK